ncbi:MAG TPA: NAD-dependent epimerase/dehydratase family protein [Puia sp.]|jgi:nucleoside-diphosphate-sugar epimerase
MKRDNVLVIGARSPIGVELTRTLIKIYGDTRVIVADADAVDTKVAASGRYEQLDVLDREGLASIIRQNDITQIFLLPKEFSPGCEQFPLEAWNTMTLGLLNVLELAKERGIGRVFWPSSVAVYGPDAPKWDCPQDAPANPATVYGISKIAGESWCRYYWKKYAVDVRSLRFPGLISHRQEAEEGSFDFAAGMFQGALSNDSYTCFLPEETVLPVMYMTDAVRATVELMDARASDLSIRGGYNVSAMSISPGDLALAIQRYLPSFTVSYKPDHRQQIARGWPSNVNDSVAATDWNWEYSYGIGETVRHMLMHLAAPMKVKPGSIKELRADILF